MAQECMKSGGVLFFIAKVVLAWLGSILLNKEMQAFVIKDGKSRWK